MKDSCKGRSSDQPLLHRDIEPAKGFSWYRFAGVPAPRELATSNAVSGGTFPSHGRRVKTFPSYGSDGRAGAQGSRLLPPHGNETAGTVRPPYAGPIA